MKKILFTMLLMCICGSASAEEAYTTLSVSGDEQAGGAAAGTATAEGTADANASATATPAAEGTADAAAPPPVVAQVDPLCVNVTCSNQGICSVANGRPVCACNAGFMPGGADGLSCVPYTPPAAVLSAPAYLDPEREAALKEFYSVLPGYTAERDYAKFARLKQYGRFTGTFPEYMEKRFRGEKAGGIAMVSVGAALTGAGVAFLVIGTHPEGTFMEDCYSDYYYYGGEYCDTDEEAQAVFLVFGTAFSVASVVMYSIGIPNLVLGASRSKKMQQLQRARPAASSGISNFKLSFLPDPAHGSYGASLGFQF